MATQVPPPSKRQRRLDQNAAEDIRAVPDNLPNVTIRFQAFDTGESLPGTLRVPGASSIQQLELLLNQLLGQGNDPSPFEFSLADSVDVKTDLWTDILKPKVRTTEDQLTLVYKPMAVFKVKTVTRSSGSAMGHGATILSAQFAPNSSRWLATGAGDNTARIWNADTQTPYKTLKGHTDWVLSVAWSPDGSVLATGSMDGSIRVWDPLKGEPLAGSKPLTAHSKFITSLSWEPLHLVPDGQLPRLASASKDGTARVWNVESGLSEFSMNSHKASVSCVKWGGFGDIYTASHDKSVKVWSSKDGRLLSTLQAHAHWVNHIALSTEFALRSGPYSEKKGPLEQPARELARERFTKLATIQGAQKERIVTASDDFTMYLWEPAKSNKPLGRMTGHQKLVNHVAFSPDGRYFASASFDNSLKLWDGRDGKFIASLRGHVGAVYQCAWSADSRLLVSCSKDTTLKVWDVKTRKLKTDLPGHTDEIYCVDWSVDGERVASGGKDKSVRFWTH